VWLPVGVREPWVVRNRRRWAVVVLLVLLAVGCSGGGAGRGAKSTERPKPPLAYVAVGASETAGRGADKPETQSWPRVLADKLGEARQVTFTGLGFDGATAPDALASSVPKAEKLEPNLVTVWLNANDIIADFAIPSRPATYERQLGELVRRLRRGGATTVLVANTPALDQLPAYLDCLKPGAARCLLPANLRQLVPKPDGVIAKVDAYNQAIARVAGREGAVLVDLHAASLKARTDGTAASLVSADGFHPSTAGHAAVAATFAEAAKKAGV